MVHDCFVRVSRHIENADAGTQFLHFFGELSPAHPRHHHIGEEQLDRTRMILHQLDGLL